MVNRYGIYVSQMTNVIIFVCRNRNSLLIIGLTSRVTMTGSAGGTETVCPSGAPEASRFGVAQSFFLCVVFFFFFTFFRLFVTFIVCRPPSIYNF